MVVATPHDIVLVIIYNDFFESDVTTFGFRSST